MNIEKNKVRVSMEVIRVNADTNEIPLQYDVILTANNGCRVDALVKTIHKSDLRVLLDFLRDFADAVEPLISDSEE